MHTEQLDSLVVAAQRYPSLAGGHFYDEVIDEVHHRIVISGSVGKADIGALLLWRANQSQYPLDDGVESRTRPTRT